MEVADVAAVDCAKLRELGRIIADDGHALTFQTFGQYRSGLLAEVCRLLGEPATVAQVVAHE